MLFTLLHLYISIYQQLADGSLKRVYISSDGEAIIMNQVFSQSILDHLAERNIALAKTTVSISGIHQPSDVSPLFKSAKAKLPGMQANNPECTDLTFSSNLMALLTKFEKEKGIDLSNSKTKIIYGCWIVTKTLQSEF